MGQDGSMHAPRRPVKRVVPAALLIIWLACMAGPPLLLMRERSGWLERLDRPGVQEDWDEFRRDMRSQSGRDAPVTGPVQRKVPRSDEPPLRVWLRDHVGLAIAAWVLFGSVLFAFFAAVVVGLLSEDQPRRGGDSQEEQNGDADDAEK